MEGKQGGYRIDSWWSVRLDSRGRPSGDAANPKAGLLAMATMATMSSEQCERGFLVCAGAGEGNRCSPPPLCSSRRLFSSPQSEQLTLSRLAFVVALCCSGWVSMPQLIQLPGFSRQEEECCSPGSLCWPFCLHESLVFVQSATGSNFGLCIFARSHTPAYTRRPWDLVHSGDVKIPAGQPNLDLKQL